MTEVDYGILVHPDHVRRACGAIFRREPGGKAQLERLVQGKKFDRYRIARVARTMYTAELKRMTPVFHNFAPDVARSKYLELTRMYKDILDETYLTLSMYGDKQSFVDHAMRDFFLDVFRDIVHSAWLQAQLTWTLHKTILPPNVVMHITSQTYLRQPDL